MRNVEKFNFVNSFHWINNNKIGVSTLPDEIFNECKIFVNECRKIKDSKFRDLFYLNNVGKNTFQCFIPTKFLEDSILLPYFHIVGKGLSGYREMRLRKTKTEYGTSVYDIWVNFCNKGDVNNMHLHRGFFSGIIFVDNDDQPTFFEDGFSLIGKEKQIVLFNASYAHMVKEKTTENERVTISFNLDDNDDIASKF